MSIQYTDKSTHLSIHHVSLYELPNIHMCRFSKTTPPCADLHCVGHAKMPCEKPAPAVPGRG